MKPAETPAILRLHRIEAWAARRREKASERGDMAGAMLAAQLETAVHRRSTAILMGSVSRYRSFDMAA